MTETNTNEQAKRKAHEQPKAADLRGLWRVLPGYFMHIPPQCDGQDRCFARAGAIIDLDDEFYRRVCSGQEFKLEPAPKGAVATVITDLRLQGYRQRLERDASTLKPKAAAQKAAVARAESAGLATGIQKPDERPRKGEAKKPEAAVSA